MAEGEAMKFYSEITKDLYDTKEALIEAEVAATKAKSDRAEKAKEVTELLKKANEAQKEANKALKEFVKEYGSFKTTIKDDDVDVKYNFWDLWNKFLF